MGWDSVTGKMGMGKSIFFELETSNWVLSQGVPPPLTF